MLELVRGAATRGVMPEFCKKLLAAFELEHETLAPTAGSYSDLGLVEPLTPREREVLSLIAEGQTNGEIAERLCLTVNTVKVHIKNIYGKLLVKNRTQAIHRAQELCLLASFPATSGRKTTPSE